MIGPMEAGDERPGLESWPSSGLLEQGDGVEDESPFGCWSRSRELMGRAERAGGPLVAMVV